jgi:predicted metal-dependent hydrolase
MRYRAPWREQETASLLLGGRQLDYLLKRSSARRTLALRVSEQGQVVVNAPWRLPLSGIEAFLQRHQDWVWQRLERAAPAFAWRNGVFLPIRGEGCRLTWQAELPPGVHLEGNRLLIGGAWETVERQVLVWYRHEAQARFPERLAHHAARLGVAMPSWRLSNARTRWGSLSPKGVVSLNWRLAKMPGEILDYVICHELAHLRQRNHSAAFWREVAMLFPEYQAAREHLRRQGHRYFEF